MTVVQNGKILSTLEMPVAGLISYEGGRLEEASAPS